MQSNSSSSTACSYATTPTMQVVAVDAATRARSCGASTPAAARQRARGSGIAASPFTPTACSSAIATSSGRWTRQDRSADPGLWQAKAASICARVWANRPRACRVSASTPGVVFEDLIILPSSVPETLPGTPGHIRAFDWKTGQQRWMFHTIPQPGELGYDTWPPDAYKLAGGANAWAGVTVDPALGHGVRRHRLRVVRLLRHHSPWRQPVLRQRAGARRANGQADLALPGREARHLGLGLPGAADAGDGDPRRPAASTRSRR